MIPFIYDQINRWTASDECMRTLIDQLPLSHLADLGCGTGRVTSRLASKGLTITAIDPNEEAITYARNTYPKSEINWIIGDSSNLSFNTYDCVVMTANVAQVFVADNEWIKVLRDVYASLKEGGHFIFDSRNPVAKVWEQWEKDLTPDYAKHPITGEALEIWTEYDGFVNDIYIFTDIVKKAASQDIMLKQTIQLKFRSLEKIVASLQQCGFTSIQVYEDGTLQQATQNAQYFIFDCVK